MYSFCQIYLISKLKNNYITIINLENMNANKNKGKGNLNPVIS